MKMENVYYVINTSSELLELELEGFKRGHLKGKTMKDTEAYILFQSLEKQWRDWKKSCGVKDMLQKLADLRNVAGCCFLKLIEDENGQKILNDCRHSFLDECGCKHIKDTVQKRAFKIYGHKKNCPNKK